jgi:hypothetical protein
VPIDEHVVPSPEPPVEVESRLMDQNRVSWNRVAVRLRRIEGIKAA